MTKDDRRIYLRALINRILDDSAQPFIAKANFCTPGSACDPITMEVLKEWQELGLLTILADPESVDPGQPLIKMIKFIDRPSSIPGFLE